MNLASAPGVDPDEFERNELAAKAEIQSRIESGHLFVAPAGFRCFTKQELNERFGILQASMPFDSGFFPPDSVANVLESGTVDLKYPDPNFENHRPCKKVGHVHDDLRGDGIKFLTSSYEEIDDLCIRRDQKDINTLLDWTYGYYTLDIKNRFILAHYNLHNFARNDGKYETSERVEIFKQINNILNNRLSRLTNGCNQAKQVLLIVGNKQKYKFMSIDDEFIDLNDLDHLASVARRIFGGKCKVLRCDDVGSAQELLAMAR